MWLSNVMKNKTASLQQEHPSIPFGGRTWSGLNDRGSRMIYLVNFLQEKSRFFPGAGPTHLKNGKWMIENIVIVPPVPLHPFFHNIKNSIQT